jgi:serine/threonine-protein kinase RsbW
MESALIGQLNLASDVSEINHLEGFINDICVQLNLEEDYFGNVLISVSEAVNNAILHGNKSDMSKQVVIHVFQDNERFWFTIKDSGRGFDFTNLPDPTSPDNILMENGRGVFLMKNLADEVEFLEGGSLVKVLFLR